MNLLTGTPISQLPTGTIDSLLDVFPLSIGVTGATPQTIQASLQQTIQFLQTNVLNAAYVTGSHTLLDGKYQPTGTYQYPGYNVTVLSSGSGTYTPPAGCVAFEVEVVGAGGGGGGAAGATSNAAAGGGGGGGGYARKIYILATGTYSYSVGNGGAGGSNAGGNGTAGQASVFSAITANGGALGNGQAAGTTIAFATGGTGGTASGGDVNMTGGSANFGLRLDGTNSLPGFGGESILSKSTRGSAATNGAGATGLSYGGGGSGGRTSNNASGQVGGTGADGVIIIREFHI